MIMMAPQLLARHGSDHGPGRGQRHSGWQWTPTLATSAAVALVAASCCRGCAGSAGDVRFEPSWPSLDTRTFPSWWEDAKIGFKIHWGPYSVPSWAQKDLPGQEPDHSSACLYPYFWNVPGSPTYEFHRRVYGAQTPYRPTFGEAFRAELYAPRDWAQLFEAAGARYAYMTVKHGDGFTLYNSSTQPHW